MRVAVITQTRARVGGAESYLEMLLPALVDRHEVAFWSEPAATEGRGVIALPRTVQVLEPSAPDPVSSLRAWRPDVLFAHGLHNPYVEDRLLGVAPAVAVEHTYHGTCISSAKTMRWPAVRACTRQFGPACLALYFPRRCGGLNPITMLRLYADQAARLATLKRCAAVVTLSEHMRAELLRHGLEERQVRLVPPFVGPAASTPRVPQAPGAACRLLYFGRLEPLKGVDRLLAALPLVAGLLVRDVRLTVAGDGASRPELEAQAAGLRTRYPSVDVSFAGWQDRTGRDRLLADTDALVVPSLWPEPFGLVGLEAAAAGVPAVGFATGGIPEWLVDGETGCLAQAAGARPAALADAIVRCVRTPAALQKFSSGALARAGRWTLERHVRQIEDVLASAAGQVH